ncbi:MAG: SAF domain-containing protein [Actinomycetota bacterium]|nr:SAF domain-containing protein [Actinomycetota bacterium]
MFTLAASFVVFMSLEPKPAGHPVLALRHDIVAGQALTAGDLKVLTVDAPGLTTIAARDETSVVGKALSVSLPAGSLISPALLVGTAGPLGGQAIVGAALKPGAFPPDLSPGARVQLYAGAADPLTAATVYTLQGPSSTSNEAVVSLMVPAKVAGTVSAAAIAGTLTLVWVTP